MMITCNCETDPETICPYFSGKALTFVQMCEIGSKIKEDLTLAEIFILAKAFIAAERKALGLPHCKGDLVE